MRQELEYFALIEQYILGQLSEEDKTAFERKMKANAQLREDVKLQRELNSAIQMAALKDTAMQAWKIKNIIRTAIYSFVALVIIAGGIYLYTEIGKTNEHGQAPEAVPGLHDRSSEDKLDAELFNLQGDQDTVVVTKEGIVFAIPEEAFLDQKGHVVSGKVNLIIKEAITPIDIMKAGLSTQSNGQLLETGGMFYIEAEQNGQQLKPNPEALIYADVPTLGKQAGMQLFDGEKDENGRINWSNPQPLVDDLPTTDILGLDFYPEKYIPKLRELGKDVSDKEYTDSLYYSFGRLFLGVGDEREIELIRTDIPTQIAPPPIGREFHFVQSVAPYATDSTATEAAPMSGVNPLTVKAIWNEKYQNTLLATKAFERRLRAIHNTCTGMQLTGDMMLRMYISNINLRMDSIDKMVLAALNYSGLDMTNTWDHFVDEGLGKVDISNVQMQMLSQYFKQTEKELRAALKEQVRKEMDSLRAEQKNVQQEREKYSAESLRNWRRNYSKELEHNLDEAYRQLGKEKPPVVRIQQPSYTARITSFGWKNVDAYVREATRNRETMEYHDKDGNEAKIEYHEVSLKIADQMDYARVYLLTKQWETYVLFDQKRSKHSQKMNEFLSYAMVAMAFKGDEVYMRFWETAKAGDLGSIQLELSSAEEIHEKLHYFSQKNMAILSLVGELEFEQREFIKQKQNVEKREFIRQVVTSIFPCNLHAPYYLDENFDHDYELPYLDIMN